MGRARPAPRNVYQSLPAVPRGGRANALARILTHLYEQVLIRRAEMPQEIAGGVAEGGHVTVLICDGTYRPGSKRLSSLMLNQTHITTRVENRRDQFRLLEWRPRFGQCRDLDGPTPEAMPGR
jgi:hypothetical protein